jgi:hypothetical protein
VASSDLDETTPIFGSRGIPLSLAICHRMFTKLSKNKPQIVPVLSRLSLLARPPAVARLVNVKGWSHPFCNHAGQITISRTNHQRQALFTRLFWP